MKGIAKLFALQANLIRIRSGVGRTHYKQLFKTKFLKKERIEYVLE